MTAYVALLRAVNVAGTGKLPMSELSIMCEAAGFTQVKTYIASGNVVFVSKDPKKTVKNALESRLETYARKKVGVIVRTHSEIADVVERNPFSNQPGAMVGVLFTDDLIPSDPIATSSGRKNEDVRPGRDEIFIFYPDGMGRSKLRTTVHKSGTTRNMNTIRKLAEMSADLA